MNSNRRMRLISKEEIKILDGNDDGYIPITRVLDNLKLPDKDPDDTSECDDV